MVPSPKFQFALTCFCLGMICLHGILYRAVWQQVLEGVPDFRIFYTAALILQRGEGNSLYNDDLQRRVEEEIAPKAVKKDGFLPFNHPPFEAVLYVPFTTVPFLPAYFGWIVLNLILLAVSIYAIRPWIPAVGSISSHLAWWLPLAFYPVAFALMEGQDSVLLFSLYCLSYCALRRDRDGLAGFVLGLGLFKFHLVLPFVFVMLLSRRWRFLAGVFAAACVEVAVSVSLVGWKELFSYPLYAWHVNRQVQHSVIVPRNMPNLRGLLTGWSGRAGGPHWLEFVLLILSVVLLVWVSRVWKPERVSAPEEWNRGFSIAVISSFLVGYHGYNQDMSIVLLPLLLTLNAALANPRQSNIPLRITLGVMFLSPLYFLLTFHYEHQNLFALVLLFLVGLLAIPSVAAGQPASASKSTAPSIAPLA